METTVGVEAAPEIRTDLLSPEELRKIDAYWRAANYLSVGQIYLYENPLLTEPLKLEHIKPRLLGHWLMRPLRRLHSSGDVAGPLKSRACRSRLQKPGCRECFNSASLRCAFILVAAEGRARILSGVLAAAPQGISV